MVKLAGAAAAVAFTTTVPAWTVVVVVETAALPDPPPEPPKDTRTTPAPMAKMARPRMSIWVDRRIAMELRRDRRAGPRVVPFLPAERAPSGFDFLVGWVPGPPDSPPGSFGGPPRTS